MHFGGVGFPEVPLHQRPVAIGEPLIVPHSRLDVAITGESPEVHLLVVVDRSLSAQSGVDRVWIVLGLVFHGIEDEVHRKSNLSTSGVTAAAGQRFQSGPLRSTFRSAGRSGK